MPAVHSHRLWSARFSSESYSRRSCASMTFSTLTVSSQSTQECGMKKKPIKLEATARWDTSARGYMRASEVRWVFPSTFSLSPCHGFSQRECPAGIKVYPHYAVRQNATHCSFATRQKLLGICHQYDRVYMKKEFFADLQVTKTVERDRRTWSDFFLKLADTILKPLIHHMPHGFFWRDRQFADQIFRLCSIERHAAAKPMQHPHILVAWRNFCCTALLHFAAVCHAA